VSENQIEVRRMQSRLFDTTDKIKTLQAAMATLQDLGFVIDDADAELGCVSGTKMSYNGYGALRITVSVRQHGETQMLVRANAQYGLTSIEDPQPYQQFFKAFEKSMFLTAKSVG
jgi:hypothetical protein